MSTISRRRLLIGGCALVCPGAAVALSADEQASLYQASTDHGFPIRKVDLRPIRREYLRQEVDYETREPKGTIVVDPDRHFLFRIGAPGRAIRYGVGVGKDDFSWSGEAVINSKREWPDWYPPREMLERQPSLMRRMSKLPSGIGMKGGPRNPLGARALYLWQDDRDTLYRIHGTTEPWTIGTNASSGCIRMMNQDVIHLYEQVDVGTRVVVLGTAAPRLASPLMRDLPRLETIVKDPNRFLERGLY